jgi:predicted benzoate:H+ symporter BenE
MLLIENVCESHRKIMAPKSLGSFTILDRFFKKCIFYLAHNCLIVRFSDSRDFPKLMDAMPTHIEAILTEVIVLAFEAVKAFASNGFILNRTLVAEILLGKLLIKLEAVRLSNLVTQSHCFRGGLGQDLNWLLPGVI